MREDHRGEVEHDVAGGSGMTPEERAALRAAHADHLMPSPGKHPCTILVLLDELERVEAERDLLKRSLEIHSDMMKQACDAVVGERDALRAAHAERCAEHGHLHDYSLPVMDTNPPTYSCRWCGSTFQHYGSVGLPEGKP